MSAPLRQRPVTESFARTSKRRLAVVRAEVRDAAGLPTRPRTRGECLEGGANAERPCPFASCGYHLALDVDPDTGNIKVARPGVEIDQLLETCALDVADRGGATLEDVGEYLNVVRERVRQIEVAAMRRLRRHALDASLDAHAIDDPSGPRDHGEMETW